MTKPKDKETYSEKEALERMNKALKGAMQKRPETHGEMVEKRRKGERRKPAK